VKLAKSAPSLSHVQRKRHYHLGEFVERATSAAELLHADEYL
jgi:hypothetical protein